MEKEQSVTEILDEPGEEAAGRARPRRAQKPLSFYTENGSE
eukprot:gene20208-39884_t